MEIFSLKSQYILEGSCWNQTLLLPINYQTYNIKLIHSILQRNCLAFFHYSNHVRLGAHSLTQAVPTSSVSQTFMHHRSVGVALMDPYHNTSLRTAALSSRRTGSSKLRTPAFPSCDAHRYKLWEINKIKELTTCSIAAVYPPPNYHITMVCVHQAIPKCLLNPKLE